MNVPEITTVKEKLENCKQAGNIKNWELPYEYLLTRLSAAIFFVDPVDDNYPEMCWASLNTIPGFHVTENTDRKLSQMKYKIEFNDDNNSL